MTDPSKADAINRTLSLVDPGKRNDAQTTYETLITGAHGDLSPDALAERLHEQRLLSDTAFCEYHADTAIEVTVLQRLSSAGEERGEISGTSRSPHREGANAVEFTGARRNNQQYDLLGHLAAGGMSEIQIAKDRQLCRKVAYKQLLDAIKTVPGVAQRFLLEAQVTAQLDHPNIVPIYDLEQDESGHLAYAMKLVRGQTLKDLLAEASMLVHEHHPLPPELSRETLLDHFLKVCDALGYAHAKGVIHRDLKPANLMIGQFGEVYVMDWGIARLVDTPDLAEESFAGSTAAADGNPIDTRTRIGDVLGTPCYMSPEQASGANDTLDARSDIYALGLILYELVCFRQAIGGANTATVLKNARQGHKRPVQAPSPSLPVPRELAAIIAKATAPDRNDRYQTASELAADIRGFLRNDPISALPDTMLRKLLRWIGRHRQATLFVLLSVLLLATAATSWSFYQRNLALTQSQIREAEITRHLTAVSEQSHTIEERFLFYEQLIEGLATATVQALNHGTPSTEPIYWESDFGIPEKSPPDLAPAAPYEPLSISTEHPVYWIQSGADSPALREKLRRLVSLRHQFARMFLLSHDERSAYFSPLKVRLVIAEQDVPLNWTYIALAEGVKITYPGVGGLPADYDVTQRPWYRLAAHRYGKFWGSPYVSMPLMKLLMPCSMSLYDAQGQFLGVASIEFNLKSIAENLMIVPDLPMNESFLLDQEGRIVVRAGNPNSPHAASDDKAQNPFYAEPAVIAEIRKGNSGLREIQRDGRTLWVAYDDLESVEGWGYVVEFTPPRKVL